MIKLGLMVTALAVGVVIAAFVFSAIAQAAGCSGTVGKASWYGTESGTRTATGERFTGRDMTAAHRSLPFGSRLRVTYRGKSVVVRVNDRGPAAYTHRVLDLSKAAAARLGLIPAGVGLVCMERLR